MPETSFRPPLLLGELRPAEGDRKDPDDGEERKNTDDVVGDEIQVGG
ncbi:MAG: hypothetical protein ACM3MD_10525 [Betaproteobacteria bacterium]